jgi:hypothetical protein
MKPEFASYWCSVPRICTLANRLYFSNGFEYSYIKIGFVKVK